MSDSDDTKQLRVRVLRREGVRGIKLRPGEMSVPRWLVRELQHRDPPVLEVIDGSDMGRQTNDEPPPASAPERHVWEFRKL